METSVNETSQDNGRKKYMIKLQNLISATQIEPVLLLYGFAAGLLSVFLNNLIIDKICLVQLDYGEDVCENIDSGQYEHEQNEVQKLTSIYGMAIDYVDYIPVVVTAFLIAALGESRGLKLPLFITTFGHMLDTVGLVVSSLFWSLPPVWIVLSFVPKAFFGGASGFFMSVYAYVGLTSDKKTRTTRLALISILNYIGLELGIMTAPPIFKQFGYLGVFLTTLITYILVCIYILVRLKNYKAERNAGSSEIEQRNMIERLKSTITTVFKKRENRGRAKVMGHITTISICSFIMGATYFQFLYTRKKFAWDYQSYSNWSAVTIPITPIGTMLILPILSYKLNIEDSVIGLLGFISRMWQFMLIGTAPVGWVMYVSSATSVAGGVITPASRSAITKLVPDSEITSIFAFVSVLEAWIPLLYDPIYTSIYNATLDLFPGTVFVIASGLSVIGCFVYMWLYHSYLEEGDQQAQSKLPAVEAKEMEEGDEITTQV